jgi:hypothetical protein
MTIAKITRPGLITTALLVACLWSCVLAQSRIVRTANRNLLLHMTRLHQLQQKNPIIPVSRPLFPGQLPRPIAG